MNIEKYRHDIDVIRSTAHQIFKDFGYLGNELVFSGDESQAYTELEFQIIPILKDLYFKDMDRFMNIMYRIDVAEKDIRVALAYPDKEGLFLIVAGLVLEREFVKCVTRKLYSN